MTPPIRTGLKTTRQHNYLYNNSYVFSVPRFVLSSHLFPFKFEMEHFFFESQDNISKTLTYTCARTVAHTHAHTYTYESFTQPYPYDEHFRENESPDLEIDKIATGVA